MPITRGCASMRATLTGGGNHGASVVGMLPPLLDPDDVETLRLVATDGDFLVRESSARFMANAPRASQLALLEVLVTDRYPQVAQPALQAMKALKPALSGTELRAVSLVAGRRTTAVRAPDAMPSYGESGR